MALLNALGRTDAEKIYIRMQNAAGETVSVGAFVCHIWENAASYGNAFRKPTTSNTGLFAGVVVGPGGADTYRDWPNQSFGLVQVLGPHGSVAYNVGGASLSCAGAYLLPVNALYSGQTNAPLGQAETSIRQLIPRGAFLLTNDLSGDGWTYAYVRAL